MGATEDIDPAYVSWKQEFELGVSRIDTEHRFFFALLNDLFAAYADLHFAGEERDLAETGCPGLADQRAQHEMFRRNLQAIRRSSARSRAALDFMRDWLVHHILETDRRCVPWLAGAPPSPTRPVPWRAP